MPLLELGAGHHKAQVDEFLEQHAGEPNITIIGKGSGVTCVDTNIDIPCGWRPKIANLTIQPEEGTCLRVMNCGEALVDDVWCNIPEHGLGIQHGIDLSGRSGVKTSWPDRGQEINTARTTCSMFQNVVMMGWDGKDDTRGWEFLTGIESDDWRNGEFFNHVRIIGGHTDVRKLAMECGDLKMLSTLGHHIDCNRKNGANGNGIHIGDRASNIWWYAPGHIEAKPEDGPQFMGNMHRFYPVGFTPHRENYERTAHWDKKQELGFFDNWNDRGF